MSRFEGEEYGMMFGVVLSWFRAAHDFVWNSVRSSAEEKVRLKTPSIFLVGGFLLL